MLPFVQVYHVRNKMDSVGLDMLLDIHGDEELPYNFINGNEVCSVFKTQLFKAFCSLPSAFCSTGCLSIQCVLTWVVSRYV